MTEKQLLREGVGVDRYQRWEDRADFVAVAHSLRIIEGDPFDSIDITREQGGVQRNTFDRVAATTLGATLLFQPGERVVPPLGEYDSFIRPADVPDQICLIGAIESENDFTATLGISFTYYDAYLQQSLMQVLAVTVGETGRPRANISVGVCHDDGFVLHRAEHPTRRPVSMAAALEFARLIEVLHPLPVPSAKAVR